MTRTELLAIAALAFAFCPVISALGIVGTTSGSDEAGTQRRLTRSAYSIRTAGIVVLQAVLVAMLATKSSPYAHGFGAAWLWSLFLSGKSSAHRLNDAGIRKRTAAVLTGLPVIGYFVMIRLAMLPSAPAAQPPET